MAKKEVFKIKNDKFIDSSSIMYNKKSLNDVLDSNGFEFGRNDNGSYIKFDNGLLICYKRQYFSGNYTQQDGNLYISSTTYQLGDWPYPFMEIPTVNTTVTSNANLIPIGHSLSEVSATNAGSIKVASPSIRYTESGNFHTIAIGKWK